METVTLTSLITPMERIQRLRESCGETEYECMKTREKAVIALEPKLACGKIKKITAASELSNYDIAKDYHCGKKILKVLLAHAQRYNLSYIFYMPDCVNLADGSIIESKWLYQHSRQMEEHLPRQL